MSERSQRLFRLGASTQQPSEASLAHRRNTHPFVVTEFPEKRRYGTTPFGSDTKVARTRS